VTTQPSGGGAAGVPVCPRHPDRESYVRCQRCERPTCPECQRPAAVGIQCVDCVRQQAKGTRVARTPFGGAAMAGTAPPRVTQTIIGLCVAVYVLQKLPGSQVTQNFEFAPQFATSEPWRLLTAAFLHAPDQLLHIVLNMYALWLTGPYLEALLGRVRFAALYLISAIGGSVGYLLLANPESNQWFTGTVGASGAVFGLFGAYFVVQRRLRRDTTPLVAIITIMFVFGFIVPDIAWQVHLGGLVTGLLASAVLAYAPRTNRTQLQAAGLVAVVVLLGLAFAVKVATVPSGLLT
jgi:membrane associated rhomboid family serine protease